MTEEIKEKLGRIGELSSNKDINIVDCLTDGRKKTTSAIDEMISYDIRAGYDTKLYEDDPSFTERVVERIASYIREFNLSKYTVLECGSGEGAKLVTLTNLLSDEITDSVGIDISWSRCKMAQIFKQKHALSPDICRFYKADIFSLPFADNSIDIVYTMQGIYGLGGHERELLSELYRVANKYLVLIEPSFELSDENSRLRMTRLNYIMNLRLTAIAMGFNVIKHELFGVDIKPENPAAVLIIQKSGDSISQKITACDPLSHHPLSLLSDCMYNDSGKLAYPILGGIPCLTPDNAIVAAKLMDTCEV